MHIPQGRLRRSFKQPVSLVQGLLEVNVVPKRDNDLIESGDCLQIGYAYLYASSSAAGRSCPDTHKRANCSASTVPATGTIALAKTSAEPYDLEGTSLHDHLQAIHLVAPCPENAIASCTTDYLPDSVDPVSNPQAKPVVQCFARNAIVSDELSGFARGACARRLSLSVIGACRKCNPVEIARGAGTEWRRSCLAGHTPSPIV